jgi:flagellar motor switch protein FliG
VGEQGAGELLNQVQEMVLARDPFLRIRSAEVEDIAGALKGEGALVASLVLSELPPRKSAELLGLLPEELQAEALQGVTRCAAVTPEARMRIAIAVMSRLRKPRGPADRKPQPQGQLRRAALILRSLPRELRDGVLAKLTETDSEVSKKVTELMVTWEDIPCLGGRALQEVLRSSDARQLALALFNAEKDTIEKIHENSSERMAAMIEEEASLLSSPKPEEVQAARQGILEGLREMNAAGDLSFEEEKQDV